MEYEIITHWQNSEAFYEYRIPSHGYEHRVVLRDRAEAYKRVLQPGNAPWTPWQFDQLVELNLIETVPGPFCLPSANPIDLPILLKTDNARCRNFIHIEIADDSDDFNSLADILFEGPEWTYVCASGSVIESTKGYTYQTFDDKSIMAHIMFAAGAFPSVGEARRSGWNKPIPKGFTEHMVTKREIPVFIWNKM